MAEDTWSVSPPGTGTPFIFQFGTNPVYDNLNQNVEYFLAPVGASFPYEYYGTGILDFENKMSIYLTEINDVGTLPTYLLGYVVVAGLREVDIVSVAAREIRGIEWITGMLPPAVSFENGVSLQTALRFEIYESVFLEPFVHAAINVTLHPQGNPTGLKSKKTFTNVDLSSGASPSTIITWIETHNIDDFKFISRIRISQAGQTGLDFFFLEANTLTFTSGWTLT
jgi:hypothetical protein